MNMRSRTKKVEKAKTIDDIDTFLRIAKREIANKGTFVLEGGRFEPLTITFPDRTKIELNQTCVGVFASTSMKLYGFLRDLFGTNVLEYIYREFSDWLSLHYNVKTHIYGIVAYPIYLKIEVDEKYISYTASTGGKVFEIHLKKPF